MMNTRRERCMHVAATMLAVIGAALWLGSCRSSASSIPPQVTVQHTQVPSATTRAVTSGAPGIGDPSFPELGNGGYDVLNYTLEITADIDAQPRPLLTATAQIQARALTSLSSFNLDFENFTLDTVEVDNQVASTERTTHELTVRPAEEIIAGQVFMTSVIYHGPQQQRFSEVQGGAIREKIRVGWQRYPGGNSVYTFGTPSGASLWYPANDHPRDKATYTLTIVAPMTYTVAANGVLTLKEPRGAYTAWTFASRDPIASYLVALVIAKQQHVTLQGPNKIPINVYVPDDKSATVEKFRDLPEMMTALSTWFGPYPFESYGVVVIDTPINAFDAMEHQTLTLYSTAVDSTDSSIVLHELAHEWFGNSVSLYNWQDIWLKEGFARYAEWLWLEHTRGREAMEAVIRETYAYQQKEQNMHPPLTSPRQGQHVNFAVYERGALTLHALRHRVGDERFFTILRTYAERYRYGNASSADFFAIAQEVSDQELDTLFQHWAGEQKLPPITDLGLSIAKS